MTSSFRFTAGRLIKNGLMFQLRTGAAMMGVTLTADENKGFFESEFFVQVEGDDAKVMAYLAAARGYMQKVAAA